MAIVSRSRPPLVAIRSGPVFDKNAPSSQRALAEIAKDKVREDLHRYAYWRTGDPDDAKDLVAEALEVVLDPQRKPWVDPRISFGRHMRRVMDDMAIEKARTGRGRFEINERDLIAATGDPNAFPDLAARRPPPDEELHALRELAWLQGLGDILLSTLRGKDDVAVAVYEAACLGHEEPAEQAQYLGVPVEEVYEAHRRLRYHAARILEPWRKEEAQRMFDARQRARKEKEPS
jgi:DNA-directed RNA polymerase specialized sigma24 family protein